MYQVLYWFEPSSTTFSQFCIKVSLQNITSVVGVVVVVVVGDADVDVNVEVEVEVEVEVVVIVYQNFRGGSWVTLISSLVRLAFIPLFMVWTLLAPLAVLLE